MTRFRWDVILTAIALGGALSAAEPLGGWRGNGTGVWLQGQPPLEWGRIPRGALDGLRAKAGRPQGDPAEDGYVVDKGQIREWLVIGPFPVEDSARDFDREPLADPEEVNPEPEAAHGDLRWQSARVAADDATVFGQAEMPWLDLAKSFGFRQHQMGYAFTSLFSPRGGKAQIVVDHSWGLKAWLNGRLVFRHAVRRAVLGGYASLSQLELQHQTSPSSKFEIDLQPGWNRLLLKLSTPGPNGHPQMAFNLRLLEDPDVGYETKNIAWMTELRGRSTSTPILVGDRILAAVEPDELVCLDKQTGRVLWNVMVNLLEAISPQDRQRLPDLDQKVQPLVEQLLRESDELERCRIRAAIDEALEGIDRARFVLPRDGHFDAHFGIVGYTMPTPVSDGTNVYVWNGKGIAACFDLDGRRKWITRIPAAELSYSSGPALAAGVLAVFQHHLFGLHAESGELIWEQPRVRKNVASLLAARLSGEEVIVTQQGEVVRPADGKILYRPSNIVTNDTGWTPGVVHGDLLYLPKYGIKQLSLIDFSSQTGDAWRPGQLMTMETPAELNHGPDGGWLDRWTAASPLVVGNYVYMVDMYSQLCVYDTSLRQVVHHEKLELNGFTHYNALAVAASPALIDGKLAIMDNQGNCLILTAEQKPRVIRKNRIATQLDRRVPLPGQEIIAYAPPLVDGDRIILRGEKYLYCIGR